MKSDRDNVGNLCTVTNFGEYFMITSEKGNSIEFDKREIKTMTSSLEFIVKEIDKYRKLGGILNKNGQIVIGFTKEEMIEMYNISKKQDGDAHN